jgi:hypothetical protein
MDHQENYDTKLANAVNDVEKGSQDDNLIPLSTGVVLERIPFPRTILLEILKNFKEPKVPTFINPDKMREEENPSDPDYIDAKQKYELEVGLALLDAGICLGTKIHSLAKDVTSPYDPEWSETFEGLGVSVPKDRKLRYLKWVKFVAAPEEDDIKAIADAVLPTIGTRETVVNDALKTFPGEEVRE